MSIMDGRGGGRGPSIVYRARERDSEKFLTGIYGAIPGKRIWRESSIFLH